MITKTARPFGHSLITVICHLSTTARFRYDYQRQKWLDTTYSTKSTVSMSRWAAAKFFGNSKYKILFGQQYLSYKKLKIMMGSSCGKVPESHLKIVHIRTRKRSGNIASSCDCLFVLNLTISVIPN